MLSHTSGVPDYFDETRHTDFADLWREHPCYRMTSVEAFLPLFEKGAMLATPGERFGYSNSGFILLGLVIEELTGRRFADFIQERIFQPCGMERPGYFSYDELPDDTANGYLPIEGGRWKSNIFSLPSVGGPDGGAFTTVGDLFRFWTAFLEGRLLSREMVERFLTPVVQIDPEDPSRHYGYGVWLRDGGRGRVASIVGRDPGVSMVSRVRLDDGLITTVLSNVQDGAWDLAAAIDARFYH